MLKIVSQPPKHLRRCKVKPHGSLVPGSSPHRRRQQRHSRQRLRNVDILLAVCLIFSSSLCGARMRRIFCLWKTPS
ncbi:hypothetical protein DCI98_25065 [Salmonella enterica subsp. enterica serovar 4,12:i:-]|nr:hypothetical protein [Salmonella enterica subsp. enterica serovar 4,12:i:-]